MKTLAETTQPLIEKGLIPDSLVRFGIRGLLKDKLKKEAVLEKASQGQRVKQLIAQLKQSPIAVNTADANEQHYELPTEFFQLVMGKYLKYSCGYWLDGVEDFTQSEADMLEITTQRADLEDGQDVLELGCGWGSLSLFMAEKYPNSNFIGISNSRTQKQFIDAEIKKRGLFNLEIRTMDMNDFDIDQTFDRVVSVEMFEHMRNYEELLARIASKLRPNGRLFVHIFSHTKYAYLYELNEGFDWMARYFFTGGIMPSDDLLFNFSKHFETEEHWRVNGKHYEKTSNGWLKNMDNNKKRILDIFKDTYGDDYKKWWNYWRIFFMSCAELWGYNDGKEWIVSHYRFIKK